MKKLSRYTKLSVLFIVVCGIAVFLVTFRLSDVSIRNDSIYSEEDIRSLLFDNKRIDHNTFLFAWKVNHSSRYRIPFVEKIDAEIVDNSSVTVYVYGKTVIGCVEHMGQYMHFDREGIVVESAGSPLEGIPLIKGLSFDDVVMNKKLEMGNSKLFDELLDLIMMLRKQDIFPDEIEYGLRNDITLYIGGNEVLLGNDGVYDYKINNLPSVMKAVTDSKGEGLYRYDMRYYNEKDQEVMARRLYKE